MTVLNYQSEPIEIAKWIIQDNIFVCCKLKVNFINVNKENQNVAHLNIAGMISQVLFSHMLGKNVSLIERNLSTSGGSTNGCASISRAVVGGTESMGTSASGGISGT